MKIAITACAVALMLVTPAMAARSIDRLENDKARTGEDVFVDEMLRCHSYFRIASDGMANNNMIGVRLKAESARDADKALAYATATAVKAGWSLPRLEALSSKHIDTMLKMTGGTYSNFDRLIRAYGADCSQIMRNPAARLRYRIRWGDKG